MDEVNIDEFLREASSAIDDPDKLAMFIREKATIAVERFLVSRCGASAFADGEPRLCISVFLQNYLPKMSIPVEKRELSDGWVLSCHGEDGGGLTLTDVTIKRENLVCQVMGGDTLFFPMFSETEPDSVARPPVPKAEAEAACTNGKMEDDGEESILDHIKLLIVNAQQHGCWKTGVGGVYQVRIVASVDVACAFIVSLG
jgi:hypothetical protein